jgi:hypothetical protein
MLNSRHTYNFTRRVNAKNYLITLRCNEAKQEHSRLMQIMAGPKRLRFTSARTAKPLWISGRRPVLLACRGGFVKSATGGLQT